jgi:cytidylate kinase
MIGYAIAIDGPVAAGKGTVAQLLAEKLHGFHLNTGAMYRCLALVCLRNNTNVQDVESVLQLLTGITFSLDDTGIFINGENVTDAIKARPVTQLVSKVAAIGVVRAEMVQKQRAIGIKKMQAGSIVIAEGRDAATRIFPDATLKIFLTAKPEVRAKRRFEQMGGREGSSSSLDQILIDTKERDDKDMNRAVDPLVKEPERFGYFVLDDSNLSEQATIAAVLQEIERRKHDRN